MIYDVIIVGAGPAGLTAAIYASRYKLKTLVIGQIIGGMSAEAYKVCNFPTYQSISGMEFTKKMQEQLKLLGIEIKLETVMEIKKNTHFIIKTSSAKYSAKKIILACGTTKEKLNVLNEKSFLGKGVSYCATCDAPLFKDKVVGVIGGGNSALSAALLLAEHAKKVYIIYRKEKFFRPVPIKIEAVEKNKKIQTIFNSFVTELKGNKFLEGVKLNSKELKLDGLFIEIGSIPATDFLSNLEIEMENGYIVVDKEQKTNVPGIFAAGDVTNTPLRQIVTACADGAKAAFSIFKELKK